MTPFGFRTRSRERDRDTDSSGIASVLAAVMEQISRINGEELGLRSRLTKVSDDAAFSQEAMENGENVTSAQVDELTGNLSRCADRIAFLEVQAVFLGRLRADVVRFIAENDLGPHRDTARSSRGH